jgi:acetoin utilization deacetylase AcuC-like enzyme
MILNASAGIGRPPVFLALEGGYNPGALASCIHSVLLEFLQQDSALADLRPEHEETATLAAQLRRIHSNYGIME